jgi:hypothetical protein
MAFAIVISRSYCLYYLRNIWVLYIRTNISQFCSLALVLVRYPGVLSDRTYN